MHRSDPIERTIHINIIREIDLERVGMADDLPDIGEKIRYTPTLHCASFMDSQRLCRWK